MKQTNADSLRSSVASIVMLACLTIASGCQVPSTTTGSPATDELQPRKAPGAAPDGMVWIPGGTFSMGTDVGNPEDGPRHRVGLNGYWMDKYEVTNAQFARFVEETTYKTIAERQPRKEDYPDARPELLVPGSAVFTPPAEEVDLHGPPDWWKYVPGACWKHPEGPDSSIKGRENHPVVQIAWEDAAAYARWAKKRLPTEAEWEFAARGGLDNQEYCWGTDKPGANGKWQANIWQGKFPIENTAEDGYRATAPVGSFPPNGFGLYDMSGNAWEWCSDWFQPDYYRKSPRNNPQGPDSGEKEGNQPQRVRRGGSFLCTDQYCWRFRPSSRDKNPADSAANHTGFRCVKDAD